jgi:hypothetical protein
LAAIEPGIFTTEDTEGTEEDALMFAATQPLACRASMSLWAAYKILEVIRTEGTEEDPVGLVSSVNSADGIVRAARPKR